MFFYAVLLYHFQIAQLGYNEVHDCRRALRYVSNELLPHTKQVVKAARPHQQEALAALYKAAQIRDRYTCVMACGTSKTQGRYGMPNKSQAYKVLVLLPSSGFVNQTLVKCGNSLLHTSANLFPWL